MFLWQIWRLTQKKCKLQHIEGFLQGVVRRSVSYMCCAQLSPYSCELDKTKLVYTWVCSKIPSGRGERALQSQGKIEKIWYFRNMLCQNQWNYDFFVHISYWFLAEFGGFLEMSLTLGGSISTTICSFSKNYSIFSMYSSRSVDCTMFRGMILRVKVWSKPMKNEKTRFFNMYHPTNIILH